MARAKASTVPAAIEGQAMGIIRRVKMRRSDQAQRARGVEHLRIERLKGTKRRAVHERKAHHHGADNSSRPGEHKGNAVVNKPPAHRRRLTKKQQQ